MEQEENKVLRAQLEMSQVRQEIDRRIQEKEEEFEHSRKNHQRALESMQASLEAEAIANLEALSIKKKNEVDINGDCPRPRQQGSQLGQEGHEEDSHAAR